MGALLYIVSGAIVTVYTMSSGSSTSVTTWTQYNCGRFGASIWCTIFSYATYGAAGLLSFVGAIMVTVSLYRSIGAPAGLPPAPPRLGLCPKCGAMNPPTSKYCNECGTRL